jgi:hypothetical protein
LGAVVGRVREEDVRVGLERLGIEVIGRFGGMSDQRSSFAGVDAPSAKGFSQTHALV